LFHTDPEYLNPCRQCRETHRDAYTETDAGVTQDAKTEVSNRVKHDYRDIGGRVTNSRRFRRHLDVQMDVNGRVESGTETEQLPRSDYMDVGGTPA